MTLEINEVLSFLYQQQSFLELLEEPIFYEEAIESKIIELYSYDIIGQEYELLEALVNIIFKRVFEIE